jgi:methylamine utilization protein MauE
MTSSGLHSTLAATAALLIAIIFLRAAWHKLRDVESFAALAADYRLLPAWTVGGAARVLIVLEAGSALALIVPRLAPVGAGIAVAMLLIYAVAMATNILRGRKQLDCGCGGEPQGLGWTLVVRNLLLMAIAGLALEPHEIPRSVGEWALAGAAGLTLWIGFLLTEQLLANASRMAWAIGEKAS